MTKYFKDAQILVLNGVIHEITYLWKNLEENGRIMS
jgi:hypothetical protein